MKKVLILILAMVLSFSVFALAACQTPCETHVDANHDGICDVCATANLSVVHADSNHDGKCDVCAADYREACADVNPLDGKCDVCGADVAHTCVDTATVDGKCDICGADVAHDHIDAEHNGKCDICGATVDVKHVDNNHDGVCDVCQVSDLPYEHVDEDTNFKCDVCDKVLEHDCVDANTDCWCDVCEAAMHADNNHDGFCDVCETSTGDPEHKYVEGVCSCGTKEQWLVDLEAAYEYLRTSYIEDPEATTVDYKVIATVSIEGAGEYTVTWTVEILNLTEANENAVKVGETAKDDNNQLLTTIDVDEFCLSDVSYKLIATISDADGHTTTVSFDRRVPMFKEATWEEYREACEAKDGKTIISVKAYVTAVNADSSSSSKGSIWAKDADGHGYYAYKPSLDASITESRESILAAFPVGTEVIITGTVSNQYGTCQHSAGCTILVTGNMAPEGWSNEPVDQTEAFSNAESGQDLANLEQYFATMVTLKGVTMGSVNGYNHYFTINGVEYIFYQNIYLMDKDASSAIGDKWVVGGKANLTGLVTTYSGKFQIYPFSVDCLEIVKEELTDAQIVERAKAALAFDFDHATAAVEKELPTEIAGYDVTLAWALDATYDFASISEGKLVISALPAAETTIKLIATITKGDSSDVVEYSIAVDAEQVGPVTSIALTAENLGLDAYADGTATVSGVTFDFVELGTYGNGIQMRQKDGKISKLWNSTALPSGIVSIEITLNADKSVYDNADVWEFKFGASADALTESVKLSTVAGQYTYTVTPAAGTHTFVSVEKIIESFTFYVDSIKINFADGGTVTPPVEEKKSLDLTVDSLGLPSQAYTASTATVSGVSFEFVELGNYGNGIQMRQKDGKISKLWNTTALPSGIVSIEITLNAGKSVFDNADVWEFKFGASADSLTESIKVSTVAGQYTYTVTPAAGTHTFLSIEKIIASYSFYVDSIKINFAESGSDTPVTPAHTCESVCEECKKCLDATCTEAACADKCEGHEVVENGSSIDLTVDSLGLPSQAYTASTATVSGVSFEFVELGNYGNGIQMRQKDGKISKLWNTTALPSGIVSIEITLNAGKSVFDNADVWEFKFGASADSLTESIKVSTVAGQYTYTVTPAAGTHTFLSIEKIIASYSFYVDSIKINLADDGSDEPAEVTYTLTMPADSVTWTEETLINDIFTATNKAKTESIKISGAAYEADGLTFSGKQISLTGGKVQLKDGVFLNGIKVVVEEGKSGHFVMYVAAKDYSNTEDGARTILISILDTEAAAVTATNIKKNGAEGTFENLSVTEVEKYEFDLPAGTYYIGGSGGGAYLYGMSVTLSNVE